MKKFLIYVVLSIIICLFNINKFTYSQNEEAINFYKDDIEKLNKKTK
jgi:hypothetical protein